MPVANSTMIERGPKLGLPACSFDGFIGQSYIVLRYRGPTGGRACEEIELGFLNALVEWIL